MAIHANIFWQEGRVEGDSWSAWDPDPVRAFRDHNPTLEPFASMSPEELLERMLDARGGREWEFLREYLVDRCDRDRRKYDAYMRELQESMACGLEAFSFVTEVGGLATRLQGGGEGPGLDADPFGSRA
jgi:hypothetical protein